jgi:hypothetical protein
LWPGRGGSIVLIVVALVVAIMISIVIENSRWEF